MGVEKVGREGKATFSLEGKKGWSFCLGGRGMRMRKYPPGAGLCLHPPGDVGFFLHHPGEQQEIPALGLPATQFLQGVFTSEKRCPCFSSNRNTWVCVLHCGTIAQSFGMSVWQKLQKRRIVAWKER